MSIKILNTKNIEIIVLPKTVSVKLVVKYKHTNKALLSRYK